MLLRNTCIWFNYETDAERFGLAEEVSFYNPTANQWTTVFGRTASTVDQTATVIVMQNAQRFAGTLGELGARIRW